MTGNLSCPLCRRVYAPGQLRGTEAALSLPPSPAIPEEYLRLYRPVGRGDARLFRLADRGDAVAWGLVGLWVLALALATPFVLSHGSAR